jgi:hypothetical protein
MDQALGNLATDLKEDTNTKLAKPPEDLRRLPEDPRGQLEVAQVQPEFS